MRDLGCAFFIGHWEGTKQARTCKVCERAHTSDSIQRFVCPPFFQPMDLGSWTRTLHFYPPRQPRGTRVVGETDLSDPLARPESLAVLLDVHQQRKTLQRVPTRERELAMHVSASLASLAASSSSKSLASSQPPNMASRRDFSFREDTSWATGGVRRPLYLPHLVAPASGWVTEAQAQFGQPQPGALPRARSASALRSPMHQAPALGQR